MASSKSVRTKLRAEETACISTICTGCIVDWFKIQDLLADTRCSQPVLDFLSTTDVGRLAPTAEDAGSELSEWELWERREKEGWKPRGWVARVRNNLPSWRPQEGVGGGYGFLCYLFCLSFVISLVRIISPWDRPGRRAKGACNMPPSRGLRTGKPDSVY